MGSITGWEDLLEEEMATHSSILAWDFPWTEECCGLLGQWPQEFSTLKLVPSPPLAINQNCLSAFVYQLLTLEFSASTKLILDDFWYIYLPL